MITSLVAVAVGTIVKTYEAGRDENGVVTDVMRSDCYVNTPFVGTKATDEEIAGYLEQYWNQNLKEVDGILRRNRLDRLTPAKLAVHHAIQAVERIGAHPLLTEAVILLGQAKDKVSDYVERDS